MNPGEAIYTACLSIPGLGMVSVKADTVSELRVRVAGLYPSTETKEVMVSERTVPECSHGPREWRSGISKRSGKLYSGWFCTALERDEQHPPLYPNQIKKQIPADHKVNWHSQQEEL